MSTRLTDVLVDDAELIARLRAELSQARQMVDEGAVAFRVLADERDRLREALIVARRHIVPPKPEWGDYGEVQRDIDLVNAALATEQAPAVPEPEPFQPMTAADRKPTL